jgi:tRNA threonylcarbamoyladenosine biosynthesis protein TsaE
MERDEHDKLFQHVGLADLGTVAEQIVAHTGNENIWLFHGDMGAGKTTLIKALGKAMGVRDAINSPTFALVNEYETSIGKKVYHFDFYRIKHEAEAFDIGVEEYFDSGDYCFIEWPDKITNMIPDEHADIYITLEDNTHRTIAISIHGGKEKNRF